MGSIPLALILLVSTVSHAYADQQHETTTPVPLHRLMLSSKLSFFAVNPTEADHFPVSGKREVYERCDRTYGFLPCTSTLVGNLFLLMIYGYFMYKSATMLSEGSELLLIVSDPGVIGGLLLPIVGVLPDAVLVAGSLLSKSVSKEMRTLSSKCHADVPLWIIRI